MKKHAAIRIIIIQICLMLCASAEETGIDALVRGQTAILRIDREWLQTYANQDLDYTPFGFISHPEEIISESRMQYFLEGAETHANTDGIYEAFMVDYAVNGNAAYATIYDVCLKHDRFTLPLYIRHTRDCWYLIFRQTQQPDSTAPTHFGIDFRNVCNYSADRIIAHGDVIVNYADMRCIPDSVMSIQAYNGDPEHCIQRGDLRMDVFRGLGAYIVVITKAATEENFIEHADLTIANDRYYCGTGYMDAHRAVYCIVMNDVELQSLLEESNVDLIPCDGAA